MITPRQTTLIIISTLFLTACGGGGSSSSSPVANDASNTDNSPPATPIDQDALNNLTLPKIHFGSRNIKFNGKLDSLYTSPEFKISLSQNDKDIEVVIIENTIGTILELTDNTNKFILTISNDSETLSREFSVEYPFVSLETFQAADVVIGQQDFTGIDSDTTASTLDAPYGNAFSHNDYLYLPDYGNNRVLGFNSTPSENGAAADFVIGQEDLTSSNSDGDGLVSLGGPQNMQVVNDQFYLLTYNSNRIIVSDSAPTTTGQLIPSFVIGQADSASSDDDCTDSSLKSPESFIIADNKLIVADSSNHRLLIWNSLPTVSGVAADIVIGHSNFTCDGIEEEIQVIPESILVQPITPVVAELEILLEEEPIEEEFSLSEPSGIWSDGKTLLVADSDNNRLLIWNTFPTANNVQPDLILGTDLLTGGIIPAVEADIETEASMETEELTQLDYPYHLHSNGNQIFLSDNNNHRLLIWNSLPTSSTQKPDVVIGQENLTNTTSNDDDQDGERDTAIVPTEDDINNEQEVASSRTLADPRGAYTIDNQLIITDGGNNRFLIFNGINN